MSGAYTPAHLATGIIRRACARLAGKYPFHARVLERFQLLASTSLETMGVTARNAGVALTFNPAFALGLDADTLGGVLLHEVHHVVLGHLGLNPADYPDHWAFTVAVEVSANEFVTEPLPKGAIRLQDFPTLPAMESFQQRYRRLAQQTARMPLHGPGGVDLHSDGKDSSKQPGVLVDDHSRWEGVSEEGIKVLADLVQQAALEAGGMPENLHQAVCLAGSATQGSTLVLVGDRPGGLNWRHLLRRYVGRVLEPGPSFTRPPRRFPDLVGVWPGQRRVDRRVSVVAIIDTSGSISTGLLEQIDGELHRLARSYPLQVVECDCQVHRVYRYAGRLQQVQGRGGTDFRPPLEPAFLRRLRPGLILYFTDGCGEAPAKPPACPMVWCLTPGGEPPAAWGRVIRMEADSSGCP